MMPKKTSGRQKIEMKIIEKKTSRQVTFTKRRGGLFKKAAELCVLTGAEVAIIVQSPGNHLYAFGHRDVDSVIETYLGNNNVLLSENPTTFMHGGYNEYLEIEKELKVEKSKSKNAVEESSGFWWENSFEDLEMDELEIFVKSLEELKKKVADKADELRNSGSSPSLIDTNVGADELRNSGSSPSLIDTNIVAADELRNSGSSPSLIDTNIVAADELRNSGSSPSLIDTNVAADELRNSVVSSPFDTNTNLSDVDGLFDAHVTFADLLAMPPFNYNSGGFDNNSFGNGDQLTLDDYQVSSALGTPGDNCCFGQGQI